MCGIFGMITPGRPVDIGACRRATDALRHRGPDGLGITLARLGEPPARFHLNPAPGVLQQAGAAPADVFLGHRRLAIIDLTPEAFQPMANEDGQVWVVFNGEIYNHAALRAELGSLGHTFATDHADTEVIVHGYEEWGPDVVHRLRGMFAFAAIDLRARRLLLARDPFGEKPLYVAEVPGGLAFASELKALLAAGVVERRIAPGALADYLRFGYVPSPKTIYRGVRKLAAAERAEVDLDEPDRIVPSRYWEPRYDPQPSAGARRWREEMEAAIDEAVGLRMMSDVPLGAYLSGGLDSTTVVRAMARRAGPGAKPRTFTIAFSHQLFDESEFARQAAERYGAKHQVRHVGPSDLLDLLPDLAEIFDEPFADSSALPSLALARMTRESVTVALSGDGGDELLGGYARYAINVLLARVFDHGPGRILGRLLRPFTERWPETLKGKGLADLLHPGARERYESFMGDSWLVDQSSLAGAEGRLDYGSFWDSQAPALLNRMCKADVLFYVPEDLATKVDRTAMSVGLEVRAPFLDRPLHDLVARAPVSFYFDGRSGKIPFRLPLERDLGRDFVRRPKQGFSVPLGPWFRGPLREAVAEAVRGGFAASLFPAGRLSRLMQEHTEGSRDRSRWLWSLLTLDAWHRTYGGTL
jgi:asparagine synthase (glutamine-hydrolysing)